MRKCVVKIRRLRLQKNTPSKETQKFPDAVENSSFEPPRNSTMCAPKQINTSSPVKREQVRLKRIATTPPSSEASSSKKSRFFHREQRLQRTRSSVTRNVYEFLSESQIKDDNARNDPAADIIQRMVNDGKACLMMRSKKDGKTRIKPIKKKVRPVGKRRQVSLKKVETANGKDQQPSEPHLNCPTGAMSPIYEPLDEDVYTDPIQVPENRSTAKQNASKQASDGAYSSLARSVLLNQTKTQETQQSKDKRRELLNMARQLISTPLNSKEAPKPGNISTTTAISPIPRHSPSGSASPWRVSDESAMPNTFVFGFNTSQLPSYSSDHIRRRHVYVPDEPRNESNESNCPAMQDQRVESITNESNEENMPPPIPNTSQAPSFQAIETSAEDVENYVHLPNPRRTQQKRTPFKDINILDVVVLPSWKKNIQTTPSKEVTPSRPFNSTAIEKSGAQSSPSRTQTRVNLFGSLSEKSPRQTEKGNLFGFEEFLNDSVATTDSSPSGSHDVTLHDKLQRLAEMRPSNLPLVSNSPLRRDTLREFYTKQQDIRDVFSSTMVHQCRPRPKNALVADESVGLFKEQEEPEVTFNEKKPRRTYVRERPKRKRKQRVQFLYVESDSSEEEDEQDSHNNSLVSPQKSRPHKRSRKDIEYEAKLEEFITSFNKQCEEVEKFPVIIE
ncbi:hypothetical protein KR074_000311 [Drosophila pseudoananassae]|nr:hypothetical protein KR074_000311 [Drosophila pseudoananassae]